MTSFNDQWLLTDVHHQGQQPSILGGHTAATRQYGNRFSAIPWSTEFRPALTRARPTIPGYQKARVPGAIGQPAQRDERGRIEVILWPDLATDVDEPGIWVPLALATPDAHLDSSRWPVGGAEVLISFLDSDPDRPVLCALAVHRPAPPPALVPGGDDRLLLDWLINR